MRRDERSKYGKSFHRSLLGYCVPRASAAVCQRHDEVMVHLPFGQCRVHENVISPGHRPVSTQ
jgi:hypothetical protein